MPFIRQTIPQLRDFYEAEMATKFGVTTPLLPKSIVRVLAYMFAGGDYMLYGFIQFFAKNAIIDTAETVYLERWATIWGISRTVATYATGNVTFTGINTTVVPAGTTIKRVDDEEFTTNANGTITGGVALIACTATLSGERGNTIAATVLSLSSPIAGIDSTCTVDANAILGGADVETDAALLVRLLNRIQQPPQGGSENDFVQWAKEVPATTRAWAIENYLGAGTVGVTFVQDGNAPATIIPNAAAVTAVDDYIDPLRPITAAVTTFAPTPIALDITVDIAPNTAEVQAAIEAEISDLLFREAEPGGTILLSHIKAAISSAAGETDHDLIIPAANVAHTANQIPVVGTYIFGSL